MSIAYVVGTVCAVSFTEGAAQAAEVWREREIGTSCTSCPWAGGERGAHLASAPPAWQGAKYVILWLLTGR